MKKLIIITINLILVVGFLNLKGQNEFNNIENKNVFKDKHLTDLYHNDMNQSPSNGTIKQKSNGAIEDYGNPPDLNWKGQFGGTAYDDVNAVISDDLGNIYITGSFAGQMSLLGNTYTSTGTREAFVAKLDNSGNLIWLTQIPATENNETFCKDICMDAVGNLYVTGYYTGPLTIGSSNLPDHGIFSLFYAKLNTLGELMNGMDHCYGTYEIGFSIGVDENNNVYIISSISNSIHWMHPSRLLKYDQSNNLVREEYYEVGFNKLIVDGNNIYYSGVIRNGDNGYLDDNVTLTTTSTYYDVFVAKSNLDGVFEWGITPSHVNNGSSSNDCIIMDNTGNFFIAGTYINSLVLGNDTLINNGLNGFITKFNPQGNFIWLKQLGYYNVKLTSDFNGNAFVTGNASLLKYSTEGIMQWEVEIENQPNTICYNSENKIITDGSDNGLIYVTQFTNEATEEWTTQFEGNSAIGYVIGMVTDDNGNIYTYNYTSGTIDYFGEAVNEGIFICKQNGEGEVDWIRQFPDVWVNTGDVGNYIAIDPENENIYITGEFQDELIIPGGPTLTPSEEGSIFIIKYDINGSYSWSLQEDFAGGELCLVADYVNNIILSGTFNETISISSTELISAGSLDCFIAKYDNEANLEWAKRAGGEITEYLGLVSVDGNNNVYLTGEFTSEYITIDNYEHLLLAGDGNIIFAKLNSNGQVLWIKSFAASNHEWYDDISWPTGIKTDIDGNSYIKGNFSYIAYFDDILLENPLSYYNKFIAKVDSDGNALWAKQITQLSGSRHLYDYNQFDIDNEGNVYFGVQASDTLFFGVDFQYNPSSINDLFIAKYSTDGNLDWVKTTQGNGYSYSEIRSVAVYNTTNLFVSGFFWNYLLIDNEELTSTNRHGFIAMFGDNISGVNEIYNSVAVEIYPNPTKDKIAISTKLIFNNSRINIYSISGKLIKTAIISNQSEIDVSSLQKGAYFTKIHTEKGVLVSRFIKL